jgi:hypothetical protein
LLKNIRAGILKQNWWCDCVQHARKHDIDLIIRNQLKKLYTRLTNLDIN